MFFTFPPSLCLFSSVPELKGLSSLLRGGGCNSTAVTMFSFPVCCLRGRFPFPLSRLLVASQSHLSHCLSRFVLSSIALARSFPRLPSLLSLFGEFVRTFALIIQHSRASFANHRPEIIRRV